MTNRKVIKSKKHISEEYAFNIIKAPIITEKATMISQYNQYVFETIKDTNKIEIKEAIENLFKVKVNAVNTLNRKGKEKRFRGRLGFRSDRKFATVTLAEGYSIDIGTGLK